MSLIDIAQIVFELPLNKINDNLQGVVHATSLHQKLQRNSDLKDVMTEIHSRYDFLQLHANEALRMPDSDTTTFLRQTLDALQQPSRRYKRDLIMIRNNLTANRTHQILNENPTRFVIKLQKRHTFLDAELLYKTGSALKKLRSQITIASNSGRNDTIAHSVKEFIKTLKELHFFDRTPILLQGIQALSQGKVMSDFLNATTLNSAINQLKLQLHDTQNAKLSVRTQSDLFNLPTSFIKHSDTFYAFISIPIEKFQQLETFQLARNDFLFTRAAQPYSLMINPKFTMISPTLEKRQAFIFQESDLRQCSYIRSKRYCPLKIVQPYSDQGCLTAMYDAAVDRILRYCPISVSKISDNKIVALGENKYQSLSAVKKDYDISCIDQGQKLLNVQPNVIHEFQLTDICTALSTKTIALFQDATDLIQDYRSKPFNTAELVTKIFKNYAEDIAEEFKISNTRNLQSLLSNPSKLSREERFNLLYGLVGSFILATLAISIKYLIQCIRKKTCSKQTDDQSPGIQMESLQLNPSGRSEHIDLQINTPKFSPPSNSNLANTPTDNYPRVPPYFD